MQGRMCKIYICMHAAKDIHSLHTSTSEVRGPAHRAHVRGVIAESVVAPAVGKPLFGFPAKRLRNIWAEASASGWQFGSL